MDKVKRAQLIAAIRAVESPSRSQRVLVSRSQFFDGNDDPGSIGCNLTKHPGVGAFDKVFDQIEHTEGVSGVYLAISEVDETYDDIWPFTDTALIATCLAPSTFEAVLRRLSPDSIAPSQESFSNPPVISEGYQLVSVWWD